MRVAGLPGGGPLRPAPHHTGLVPSVRVFLVGRAGVDGGDGAVAEVNGATCGWAATGSFDNNMRDAKMEYAAPTRTGTQLALLSYVSWSQPSGQPSVLPAK
jgi:hypothetical protein